MTVSEVMEQLAKMGSEQTKKVLLNHGAKEPFFGVKIGDMKAIQKKVKKDYKLSLDLFNTGNYDAMYLAGLIADEKQMTKADLQHWAEKSNSYAISEYTVAWIAAESNFGFELAKEWVLSGEEKIATAGWSTLSSLVAIKPDAELDMDYLSKALDTVGSTIHQAQNRVKYSMNSFVIAVGSYVEDLAEKAAAIAKKVGPVTVFMGNTACKVPLAEQYIDKVIKMGKFGNKKKMARC
ncbi:MAG TPA: DNA alkylation repair protein [Bacteroidia bacterium]|nr:DNA alkylation repair protein [Bacteroidia bacterium]